MIKLDRQIDCIYTLIAENDDGQGIVQTMPPFITSDKAMAIKMFKSMKDDITKEAVKEGVNIKLVQFSHGNVLEVIDIKNFH
jgi:hypothetical protein